VPTVIGKFGEDRDGANGHAPAPRVRKPAAPEKDTPVAVVEIIEGARGGGTEPARSAARNGDTAGTAGGGPVADAVEVVEVAEIDSEVAMPAAIDDAAAEDIRSQSLVIPCKTYWKRTIPF
jgi:hypothetical protein